MIDAATINLFGLILMRMFGCIFLNPIFGRNGVPATFRAGLTLALTFAVLAYSGVQPVADYLLLQYFVLLLKEFLFGYVIGFIVSLFSYAVTFGGEIMDLEMGISMSRIYDPSSSVALTLMSTFFNAMYMLLFFIAGGHITLVQLFILSGDIAGYGAVRFPTEISSAMIAFFCQCTVLAMKFAFPVIAVELMTTMGMGIIMKAVPQINVFVISIQAKLLIGLLLILMMYMPFTEFLEQVITSLFDTIPKAAALMR